MKKTIIFVFVAAACIVGCGEDCSIIEQNILMTKNQIQLKKDELAKITNQEEWLNIKSEITQKEKQFTELKQQVENLNKERDAVLMKIIEKQGLHRSR